MSDSDSLGFQVGELYNRRSAIHDRFEGQQQGGISTPAIGPNIFLFTGESGERYGYKDGWNGNIFQFTGEGQRGDMKFRGGNAAIKDHLANGKELHLFQATGKGKPYRYLGRFDCTGYDLRRGPDRDGAEREVIIFHLLEPNSIDERITEGSASVPKTLDELRQAALAAASDTAVERTADARRHYYQRSEIVRLYVLARASGVCEACAQPAPFKRENGEPYLEPHHIRRVADGGPDDPRYMAAVCPNCHREAHSGASRRTLNARLAAEIREKELQKV